MFSYFSAGAPVSAGGTQERGSGRHSRPVSETGTMHPLPGLAEMVRAAWSQEEGHAKEECWMVFGC